MSLSQKTKHHHLRLPEELLQAIQDRAKREGIPYQRLIRQALEREVGGYGIGLVNCQEYKKLKRLKAIPWREAFFVSLEQFPKKNRTVQTLNNVAEGFPEDPEDAEQFSATFDIPLVKIKRSGETYNRL